MKVRSSQSQRVVRAQGVLTQPYCSFLVAEGQSEGVFALQEVVTCDSKGKVQSIVLRAGRDDIVARRRSLGRDPAGQYVMVWNEADAAALDHLEYVMMSGVFTGGVLPEVDPFSLLLSFMLENNSLTGTLPSTIPPLVQLYMVRHNALTGSVPASLISRVLEKSGIAFDASVNQLSGTLPPLPAMGASSSITLYRNRLTGPITAAGSGESLLFLVDSGGCARNAAAMGPEEDPALVAELFGCPIDSRETNCFDCSLTTQGQRNAAEMMNYDQYYSFDAYCAKVLAEGCASDGGPPTDEDEDDTPPTAPSPSSVQQPSPALAPTVPTPAPRPDELQEDEILGLSVPTFAGVVGGSVAVLLVCCALVVFCVCGASIASRRRSQRLPTASLGRSHNTQHGGGGSSSSSDSPVRRSRRNSRARTTSTGALRRQGGGGGGGGTADTSYVVSRAPGGTTASSRPSTTRPILTDTPSPTLSTQFATEAPTGSYGLYSARYDNVSSPLT